MRRTSSSRHSIGHQQNDSRRGGVDGLLHRLRRLIVSRRLSATSLGMDSSSAAKWKHSASSVRSQRSHVMTEVAEGDDKRGLCAARPPMHPVIRDDGATARGSRAATCRRIRMTAGVSVLSASDGQLNGAPQSRANINLSRRRHLRGNTEESVAIFSVGSLGSNATSRQSTPAGDTEDLSKVPADRVPLAVQPRPQPLSTASGSRASSTKSTKSEQLRGGSRVHSATHSTRLCEIFTPCPPSDRRPSQLQSHGIGPSSGRPDVAATIIAARRRDSATNRGSRPQSSSATLQQQRRRGSARIAAQPPAVPSTVLGVPNVNACGTRKLSTHSVRETSSIDFRPRRHSAITPHNITSPAVATTNAITPTTTGRPTTGSAAAATPAMINQYAMVKEIGEGSFGKVLLVLDTQQNRYFACKAISKKRLRKKNMWRNGPQRKKKSIVPGETAATSAAVGGITMASASCTPQPPVAPFDYMQMVRREIAILKRLSCHPRVSTLVEVLDDATHDTLYMIFELCEYGSIMKIRTDVAIAPFPERLACRYFRDIMLGLEYLHHMEIIHCDIKPENILLNDRNHAVIGDFSIAYSDKVDVDQQQMLGNGMLTPVFTPPERITLSTASDYNNSSSVSPVTRPSVPQHFSPASDIWALGVTLFCFVHGRLPFHAAGRTLEQLYTDIVQQSVSTQISNSLAPSLRNLIERLMERDPARRITIPEIRVHPWVMQLGPLPSVQDNCVTMVGTSDVFSQMSEEELTGAIKPAVALVDRLRTHFTQDRHHHRKSSALVKLE